MPVSTQHVAVATEPPSLITFSHGQHGDYVAIPVSAIREVSIERDEIDVNGLKVSGLTEVSLTASVILTNAGAGLQHVVKLMARRRG